MTPQTQSLHRKYSKRTRIALSVGALFLIVFAVYGAALGNASTNWDDPYFVSEHRPIHDFDLKAIFSETTLGNYYPVTILTFAVDAQICGTQPLCYHVTSLVFHLLGVLALFSLIYFLSDQNVLSALVGASLFAVHPLNVEAVSWIAARNQVVSTFFLLLSLTFYVLYLKTDSKRRHASFMASLIFFTCSLLSRPSAVAGFVLFPILDGVYRKNLWRRLPEKILFAIPTLVIVKTTLGARSIVEEVPIPEIFEMSFLQRLTTAGQSLLFYFSRSLHPQDLRAYYDYLNFEIDAVDVALVTVLVVTAIFLVRRGRGHERRVLLFSLAWFPLLLLTTLKIIPFGEYSLVHDRYAYASLAGLCLFAALGFKSLRRDAGFYRKVLLTILTTAVVALMATKSALLTRTWNGSENLWKNVLAFEESAIPLNNLGIIYLKQDQPLKAKPFFERAIKARPRFSFAYFNLGEVEFEIGNIEKAEAHYLNAVHLRPTYHEAYNNLGNIYSKQPQKLELAKDNFKKAIKNGADYPEPHYNIASVLAMQGQDEAALGEALKVTWRFPEFMHAHLLAGDLHLKLGDVSRARASYQKVADSKGELSELAKQRLQRIE